MTVYAAGMVAFFAITTCMVTLLVGPVRRPRERRADIEYWPGFLHKPEGAR